MSECSDGSNYGSGNPPEGLKAVDWQHGGRMERMYTFMRDLCATNSMDGSTADGSQAVGTPVDNTDSIFAIQRTSASLKSGEAYVPDAV